MENKNTYTDVILPLALPGTYTFELPDEMVAEVAVGKRALVQFGRGTKHYTVLIRNIHNNKPEKYKPKKILEILDENPVVNKIQLLFWDWLADYYMCHLGEVMTAALTAGLRLSSESNYFLINSPGQNDELTRKESSIISALQYNTTLNLKEISNILGIATVQPIINRLIQTNLVGVQESLRKGYKPKTEKYVFLNKIYQDEEKLKQLFDELGRAPKQVELLMQYISASQFKSDEPQEVTKRSLLHLAGASSTSYKTLEKKGVFETKKKEINRLESYEKTQKEKQLSEAQTKAYKDIKVGFKKGKPALLHGVTSSGKTEIYVKLINEALKQKRQVLYLLPEIALTTHLINRLRKYFGNKIGVYHSRFNENERVELWNEVLNFEPGKDNRFQIVMGARSALFLPFKDLGLIIVDEEHEVSFKQFNPAPRYNARDASIMLSTFHDANVLLGSATPSVESYYNARQGKYHLVELNERYGQVQLPEIFCADLKKDKKRKKMQANFSEMLYERIQEALDNREQVILFQNRRGFAPVLLCEVCGHIPQCKNCDVSLTYHKKQGLMRCHHCGYSIGLHSNCDACGSHRLRLQGFGTEQIEDDLNDIFPDARIARLDWDSTRAKNSFANILSRFDSREIDIMVGTQMITKGLDFGHVSLVGILNADSLIHFPDFRAAERAFHLMAQVSGRAGRKKKRGKVVIQSFKPEQKTIQQVIDNDYNAMFKDEMKERQYFSYPPFVRLLYFTIKDKDLNNAQQAADFLARSLKNVFGDHIMGPEFCLIPRLQQYYQLQMMLKVGKKLSLKKSKVKINEIVQNFERKYRSRLIIDVDPM